LEELTPNDQFPGLKAAEEGGKKQRKDRLSVAPGRARRDELQKTARVVRGRGGSGEKRGGRTL